MLAFLIGGCALLGLMVGSFLNVVIYRVPRGESVVTPRSRCPSCGVPIKERDNIPVVSWLVLRGRCRSCTAPISPRYLVVEVLTGALFAGAAARLGFNWDLPAFLAMLAGLVALSWIDVEKMILPKKVVYPTLALVALSLLIAAATEGEWHRLLVAIICAASWFAVFFLVNLVSPRALGFGDVRLAPVLGLALGWLGVPYVVLGFFAANLIGAVIGIALLITKRVKRNQPVPYGVFLALGAAFALYAGPELIEWFDRLR